MSAPFLIQPWRASSARRVDSFPHADAQGRCLIGPEHLALWRAKRESNPLMRVPDLDSIVDFATSLGLVSLIDNTFATPVNFRPLERRMSVGLEACDEILDDLVHALNASKEDR